MSRTRAAFAIAILVLASSWTPVSAIPWSVNFGVTVIDNGPTGLPGNNQYAIKCGSTYFESGSSAVTVVEGHQPAGCNQPLVGADAARYFVSYQLWVYGAQCGVAASALSVDQSGGAGVSQTQSCGANGSNSTEKRTFGYFKGGFCAPGECAYGYQFHDLYWELYNPYTV